MPHIPNTPESLLPRSDSKNPATTCRGMTASGRPCRRSIAPPLNSLGGPSSPLCVGASASHHSDKSNGEVPSEAYFCWQHKEQASRPPRARDMSMPLQQRNSVDTLVSRLGVLNLTSSPSAQEKTHVNLPKLHREEKQRPYTKKKTRPSLLSLLCCGASTDDDDVYVEVVKIKKRPAQGGGLRKSATSSMSRSETRREFAERSVGVESVAPSRMPFVRQPNPLPISKPHTLSPQITAQIRVEASKPISPADKDGYIYMYWLTSEPLKSATQASCLLDPLSPAAHVHCSQQSLGSNNFANSIPGLSRSDRTSIVVKIGRATNVHRRLSSWQQQCGYNLALIRFYPYVPSKRSSMITTPQGIHDNPDTPSEPKASGVRKVPYCHRVERLIHLELSENRVKQDKCITCGKEHREWFEVEATREAVQRVDEVIRRWVAWAEQLARAQNTIES